MKYFFSLLLVVVSLVCTGQDNTKIDSAIIHYSDSIIALSKSLWYNDTDSSRSIAEDFLTYSKNIGYQRGIAEANNLLGVVYDLYGDYDKALAFYKESFDIYQAMGDSLGLANCQYNMGLVLQNDGQHSEALKYVSTASEYYKRAGIEIKIAMSSMTLGNMFLNNNYSLDSILTKFDEAESISRKLNDTVYICSVLSLKGNALLERNYDLTTAINSFSESIDLMNRNIRNPWNLGYAYYGLSNTYSKVNDYQNALIYNEKAISEYEKIHHKKGIHDSYKKQVNILEALGNFQQAVASYKMLNLYNDSIYNETRSKQINQLKTAYETEKKEAEIENLSQKAAIQELQLKQKNQTLITIGVLVSILLLASYFFYYRNRLKSEQKHMKLEQRFLRSQLNPHFIFNALGSIQNFMLKNSAQEAGLYLAKFSKLMRQILENSREEFITVDEEVQMLTNYLDINRLQLNNSFKFNISMDDEIDPEQDTIPPMFVQPFVENAIKHGIGHGKNEGLIEITFSKKDQYIQVEISDNGQGLKTKTETSHKSLATSIINERIGIFNKNLKHKIELLIEDIKGENKEVKGTRVELKMPFRYI